MLPPEMPPFESNLTVMSFPNREELLFRTCLRGCARLANKAPSGVWSRAGRQRPRYNLLVRKGFEKEASESQSPLNA